MTTPLARRSAASAIIAAGGATRGGRHRGASGLPEAALQYATRRRHGEQVCLQGPASPQGGMS